ncbi:RPAP1 family protein [Entamoeba histolytica HM-1:IMSS-B]|uniref:RPAP1 C-terminal domain-containing protein n=5 Tax=Entamoeba histolytica TaxID=5759 RepID=C4MAW2_ENTH1|nr:hypothetical protein EHI_183890 [Entamoeba histolytica HM-1:IMSS]EMH75126.1 RPAP1 family protein [Entamoeba histolytica HM-1:IMSS-B]EMS13063.1 RPAP1 family protein [Entamoeba histolytica HM-3:IMSS]ENY60640.1 hypothetical protein EHI7A_134290 [Entamoeba histolytica HM-1:IMSS-A]GAT99002.1 hypothetical protein CL6EHI_183890 [Entamoeba histolytica]EAL42778.1 hypothetical protein EHI_183890 [Entamoeba histolytica HM-1:IMSS]|eukprot:XP_648165.1 hypothetical protein EHI_183890 [Entamoeba histolytica HM-1:IMSS]
MEPPLILTTCTHEDDCPHCRLKQQPKGLPDIKEKPKRTATKPIFETKGFPSPQKKYQSTKKPEIASKETVDFIKMLHKGHSHCEVTKDTVSVNASWMGFVERPKVYPELTINNMRFGFAGEVLPFEVDLAAFSGLYNHGEDQWAAGYSFNEIGMLIRSNVVSQVRAMLGIIESICDRCNGIYREISYPQDDGTYFKIGGEQFGDKYYYKNISKEDVFRHLWLNNDVFASLCEVILNKDSTTLYYGIEVLYKMLICSPPDSLHFRAAMKNYFLETKTDDEKKEDIIQRYLKLHIVGKLIEYMKIIPSNIAVKALWITIGFFRLGKDYQSCISEDEKKQLVAQISQKKSPVSHNIGTDETEKALAHYIASEPDVLPISIDETWSLVDEISKGFIPENGKILLITSLVKNKSLEIDNVFSLHQAKPRGAIGYQFMKETIKLLTLEELEKVYCSCEYEDLFSALLCVSYAAEIIRRNGKLHKTFKFNQLFYSDELRFKPKDHKLYQILPTCDWEFEFPYFQLALCSVLSGNTLKEFQYHWNETGAPTEGICLSLLKGDFKLVIKHLPEICITFGKDCFILVLKMILKNAHLSGGQLEEYFFSHFINQFTEVTIGESFPQYPDILSIGFCSQNDDIVSQTFELVISLLPKYEEFIIPHYTSILNLLKMPQTIFNIKMDLIESYIKTFSQVSQSIIYDPLYTAKQEIKNILEEQKMKGATNVDAIADQNDILLIQQSKEYQNMFANITLFNQTSLNHPLLSFLILPFYHPAPEFLEALQFSIGSFGTIYPFNKTMYLKTSDNSEYLRLIIQIYKSARQWNDVVAAALSYTIIKLCEEDQTNIKFYELTNTDINKMKNLVNNIFKKAL